jgi:TrpR-related protein YerC/YecD
MTEMKEHRAIDARRAKAAERSLYDALLSLRTAEECQRFLADLCTPAELEAMVDRWAVVPLLNEGVPYRKIHDVTGVSVTTIGRVARCLQAGKGGYQVALSRLGQPDRGETLQ